jgi:uncharacterized repeat protein (TIGR03803 family)
MMITLVAMAWLLLGVANAASSEKVLYTFQGGTDGANPSAGVIFDKAGNLYGPTAGGGTYGYGTVYKLSRESGGWKETILYSFSGAPDGEAPLLGSLVMDSQGNLYGTTALGGNRCGVTTCGVVYEVDTNGVETVIHRFTGQDGQRPMSTLIFDSHGDLFGTTVGDLVKGGGVVFELMPGSNGTWEEKTLYMFTGWKDGGDGAGPMSGVIFDKAGNLYGTTSSGGNIVGTAGCGVVFELQPSGDSWNESVLYRFNCAADGGVPYAGVVLRGGNLYGTTDLGGNDDGRGDGVVFELEPGSSGWSESVLYTFNGRTDGHTADTGVIFDKTGNLYGATVYGGWRYCDMGCGTVFKLTSGSGGWQETVLYRFNGPGVGDGDQPDEATLVSDSKGHLYGTTPAGGILTSCAGASIGCGVVFEVTP